MLWHRLLGGQCLSMTDYVAVTGPTDGAPAPPEGGNVGYPPCPPGMIGSAHRTGRLW